MQFLKFDGSVDVDVDILERAIAALYAGTDVVDYSKQHLRAAVTNTRLGFSTAGGFASASPFKVAGHIAYHIVCTQPLRTPLPGHFGNDILTIPNHDNAVLGFVAAMYVLSEAVVTWDDPGKTEHTLEAPPVSRHSFVDIVEALAQITGQCGDDPCVKLLSLLFEQMAYKTNPDAEYPSFWPLGNNRSPE